MYPSEPDFYNNLPFGGLCHFFSLNFRGHCEEMRMISIFVLLSFHPEIIILFTLLWLKSGVETFVVISFFFFFFLLFFLFNAGVVDYLFSFTVIIFLNIYIVRLKSLSSSFYFSLLFIQF